MIKITLEANGRITQVITTDIIREVGIKTIVEVLLGWLSIFYDELFDCNIVYSEEGVAKCEPKL